MPQRHQGTKVSQSEKNKTIPGLYLGLLLPENKLHLTHMELQGEYVMLGGVRQWISYNADAGSKPLLLFLHGGPGWVVSPLLRHYCKPLYENYLVVHWDQRGSGKSYAGGQHIRLTLEQLITDGEELVQWLCKRFRKGQLAIIAHSSGTVPGIHLCRRLPQFISKYIGVGQVGNWLEGEHISYAYTLAATQKSGQQARLQKLESIGPPPYRSITHLIFQRQCLLKAGGTLYGKTNYCDFFPLYMKSDSYSLYELMKAGLAMKKSLKQLWDECLTVDLLQQAPEVAVPVCFISGRHDYQVPAETAQVYFDQLKAPSKTWHWFEQSAHMPMFEEPERFAAIVRAEV
jgi:pimeloyl-ACP methyl ester carboxylesterase